MSFSGLKVFEFENVFGGFFKSSFFVGRFFSEYRLYFERRGFRSFFVFRFYFCWIS